MVVFKFLDLLKTCSSATSIKELKRNCQLDKYAGVMIIQAGIKVPSFCILKRVEMKKDNVLFENSESKCNPRKK